MGGQVHEVEKTQKLDDCEMAALPGGHFLLERGEGTAEKTKEFVEEIEAKDQEKNDEHDGKDWVRGRKPSQPDGKKVFADAERPIGKRLGDSVCGGARAGFGAVGSQRNGSCEERSEPAPFAGEAEGNVESKNGGGEGADECVDEIPDGVEVRNFVGEEFEYVETDGKTKNDRMR